MKFIKLIQIAIFMVLLFTIGVSNAQSPPHPNSGGAPTTGNNTTVGGQQGGAPIGSGNFLLIGLALLYATKKSAASRRMITPSDNAVKE